MKYATILPVVALTVILSGCGATEKQSLQMLSRLGYEFNVDDYLRAAADGSLQAVRIYRAAGMPVDASNTFLDTALIRASRAGRQEIVEQLLRYGAQPNVAGRYGRSALIHACDRGYQIVAELLLQSGADAKAVDDKNWDALTMAAYRGHKPLVKLLIPHNSNSLDRALMVAAVGGDVEVVEMLIQAGAHMKVSNATGRTPLLLAAENGHQNVCAKLLSYGADPLEKDDTGNTAALLAETKGFPLLAEMLEAETQGMIENAPIAVAPAEVHSVVADYAGAYSEPAPVYTYEPRKVMPADGLTIRVAAAQAETTSVIPTPLLRDQWPCLEGRVLKLHKQLEDTELDEVFYLREFNYEPALLTFLGVKEGQAMVRLAGEEEILYLSLGDRIPNTSMEVVKVTPRIRKDENDPSVYLDRSRLMVEDLVSGVRRTITFGETRDEGSPYAVISVGGSQQEYWVRPGHSFTLLRPGAAAQDYKVVSLRPSRMEIENMSSREVIPITRQGMVQNRKKGMDLWTLGFFR